MYSTTPPLSKDELMHSPTHDFVTAMAKDGGKSGRFNLRLEPELLKMLDDLIEAEAAQGVTPSRAEMIRALIRRGHTALPKKRAPKKS
jgi:hypothetical protein